VGFKLPSAGVTPAPSDKKSRNVEDDTSLHGSVRFVIQSEAKNPGSFFHLDRDAGDEAT
jgi:hypothetical protein